MRNRNKFLVAIMAAVMAFAVALPAFAQTVGTATEGKGSITINNAAMGETYSLYKLFSATNSTAKTDGTSVSIAYTGDIPSGLGEYFAKDKAGNITATDAAKNGNGLSEAAIDALSTWAEGQSAVQTAVMQSGTTLVFAGLDYGYYVVTSSQGNKAISVDSTNPNATIIDKNTTTTINNPTKTVDDNDVNIGQTVTYTVSFGTANFDGTNKVVKYIISDNFASGVLTDINVTSIKVGENDLAVQQFTNGKIEIPWVAAQTANEATLYDCASLYENGAQLTITYTATVADTAAIDGAGNTNTVTIDCNTVKPDGTNGEPSQETTNATIFTYAIALQKVDASGKNLSGATFQFPFYVQKTIDSDGAYIYAGTTAGDDLTNQITTPENGLIIVKGVASGNYSIEEISAPSGYNKLVDQVTVTATKTGKSTTEVTTYFDENGEKVDEEVTNGFDVLVKIGELAATPIVVVNHTGTELPSTGGIGTTVFYVVGGVMVVGAIVYLLTKRRMDVEE